MQITRLHHVSINVSDVGKAIGFYTGVLGFTLREDRPAFDFDGAWLDIADQQLHLIAKSVPDALGQHFALQVDDLDVAVNELRARGIEISDPVPVATSRQAFLSDPSGNVVELQEVASTARS